MHKRKKYYNYTPTRREGAILQSPCPFVRPFTLSLKMSQLILEEMILFLIHEFGIVTCTVSPLSRLTAHLLPFYRATYNFAVMKTFVTDISASIRRTDFIIGI